LETASADCVDDAIETAHRQGERERQHHGDTEHELFARQQDAVHDIREREDDERGPQSRGERNRRG